MAVPATLRSTPAVDLPPPTPPPPATAASDPAAATPPSPLLSLLHLLIVACPRVPILSRLKKSQPKTRRPKGIITRAVYSLLILLGPLAAAEPAGVGFRITFNEHRRNYEKAKLTKLKYGQSEGFTFGRFQSPNAIDDAMSSCRSSSSFKHHIANDGREGFYCSTRLGGDWVLAESKQIAKNCRPVEVLCAYLDGANQKKWNEDKVQDIKITRTGPGTYRQEMILKPQRVLTGKTTVMRYTQMIRVDKIGNNYNAFVELDVNAKTNTKQRPFNILAVNVGLEQVGEDVHIYAAGLMRVNRSIVPNLIVFDASGIAGAMAGKGTLWLSSHFARRSPAVGMAKRLLRIGVANDR